MVGGTDDEAGDPTTATMTKTGARWPMQEFSGIRILVWVARVGEV